MSPYPKAIAEGIHFYTPAPSRYTGVQELRDTAGNQWWLVDNRWLLIEGQRYRACERAFARQASRQTSARPDPRVLVGQTLYQRIVFCTPGDPRERVGYLQLED